MRGGGGGSSTRAAAAAPRRRLLGAAALAYNLGGGATLDNGLRVPPMGWSSWYGGGGLTGGVASAVKLLKPADP